MRGWERGDTVHTAIPMSTDTLLERNELRSYLDEQLHYPVTLSTVREQIGSTTLVAPDTDESETITSIVENVEDDSFETEAELFETIVSRLPDAYIGRKYYDDRGSNPDELHAADDESL